MSVRDGGGGGGGGGDGYDDDVCFWGSRQVATITVNADSITFSTSRTASLKEYRAWLRDCSVYKRKAAHGLKDDAPEGGV